MPSEPAAFLSYAHFDDEASRGFISDFRTALSTRMRSLTSKAFTIFQDRDSLGLGTDWRDGIESALHSSLFLIPFVTPSFLASPHCREEVARFIDIEAGRGANDLILPVYFIATPEIEDAELRVQDEIADALARHQMADFRRLDGKKANSAAADREIRKIAESLKARLGDARSGNRRNGPSSRIRVINGPPDFVPSSVRDRHDTFADLVAIIDHRGNVLVELDGDPGIGKTAVVARLFRDFPGPMVFDYLSTLGYPAVTAASVLMSLARAHPDEGEQRRLAGRVKTPDRNYLDKLDDVLIQLGSTRVLLVIDNAETLLDQGEFRDQALATLFEEIARAPFHRVQVLLVTTEPWRNRFVHPISIGQGLESSDLADFIDDLESARPTGLARLSPPEAERLERLTGGHPRTAELVFDIVGTRSASLAELASMVRRRSVLQLLVDSLSKTEVLVVRALAVFARPVEPDALSALLGTAVRPDEVRTTLAELTRRRIIRRTVAGFSYLPGNEPEELVVLLADEDTRQALRRRAADYFDQRAYEPAHAPAIRSLDDLTDFFDAIDLRIAEGDVERALTIVHDLDTWHLKNWGQSDALTAALTILDRKLTDPGSRVLNGSLLGRALAQQGRLAEAIQVIVAASALNRQLRDTERRMILLVQLGSYHLLDGRVGLAGRLYQEVITRTRADDTSMSLPSAYAGLALCQMELGEFTEALINLDIGKRELAGRPAEPQGAELAVRLSLYEAAVHLEFDRPRRCLDLVATARSAAADIKADLVIGQCDDLAARAWLISNNLMLALESAEKAYRVAARTRNPDLCRTAGVTLATIHLLRGDESDAFAAANAAARYTRNRLVIGPFALQGIAALRRGNHDLAERAFYRAEELARELRAKEPRNYRVLEIHGFVLAGQTLLRDGADDGPAAAALREARRISDLPGANRQRQTMLAALLGNRPHALLPQVWQAVE